MDGGTQNLVSASMASEDDVDSSANTAKNIMHVCTNEPMARDTQGLADSQVERALYVYVLYLFFPWGPVGILCSHTLYLNVL